MLDNLLELDKNLNLVTLAETDLLNQLERLGFHNLVQLVKNRVDQDSHDDLTYELDSLNDELQDANERIAELESQLSDVTGQLEAAQRRIDRLETVKDIQANTDKEYIETVLLDRIRRKLGTKRGKTALKVYDKLPMATKENFSLYLASHLGIDFDKHYGKYLFEGIDNEAITIKVKY